MIGIAKKLIAVPGPIFWIPSDMVDRNYMRPSVKYPPEKDVTLEIPVIRPQFSIAATPNRRTGTTSSLLMAYSTLK